MKAIFHSDARDEAERATRYYTNINSKLGLRFEQDLQQAVSRIIQNPQAWHPLKKGYRRCSLSKFSFGVIYRIDRDQNRCLIFAVMHFKQRPDYWRSRKF